MDTRRIPDGYRQNIVLFSDGGPHSCFGRQASLALWPSNDDKCGLGNASLRVEYKQRGQA